jgi:hypothetical protein
MSLCSSAAALQILFLLAATLSFILAANYASLRVNWQAMGLLFLSLALLSRVNCP